MCCPNVDAPLHIFSSGSSSEESFCSRMEATTRNTSRFKYMDTMAPASTPVTVLLPGLTRLWTDHRLSIALVSCLVALTIIATWRHRRRNDHTAQHRPLAIDVKSPILPEPDIFSYLPPPPGSAGLDHPYARDDLAQFFNSGHLAAKADREAGHHDTCCRGHGPWRRRSCPLPCGPVVSADPDSSAAESSLATPADDPTPAATHLVKADRTTLFFDPDLNGIWRRRTLEFMP